MHNSGHSLGSSAFIGLLKPPKVLLSQVRSVRGVHPGRLFFLFFGVLESNLGRFFFSVIWAFARHRNPCADGFFFFFFFRHYITLPFDFRRSIYDIVTTCNDIVTTTRLVSRLSAILGKHSRNVSKNSQVRASTCREADDEVLEHFY